MGGVEPLRLEMGGSKEPERKRGKFQHPEKERKLIPCLLARGGNRKKSGPRVSKIAARRKKKFGREKKKSENLSGGREVSL